MLDLPFPTAREGEQSQGCSQSWIPLAGHLSCPSHLWGLGQLLLLGKQGSPGWDQPPGSVRAVFWCYPSWTSPWRMRCLGEEAESHWGWELCTGGCVPPHSPPELELPCCKSCLDFCGTQSRACPLLSAHPAWVHKHTQLQSEMGTDSRMRPEDYSLIIMNYLFIISINSEKSLPPFLLP